MRQKTRWAGSKTTLRLEKGGEEGERGSERQLLF